MKIMIIALAAIMVALAIYKVVETRHRIHHCKNCEYRADQVIVKDEQDV